MYKLKIGNDLYDAEFVGKNMDKDWDGRESKTINLKMSYDMATIILHDDVQWHIYRSWLQHQIKVDETGAPIVDPATGEYVYEDVLMEEDFDNSDFSMMGDVTVHPDGTTSVKMGKPTDLEQAYEILYGGM